MAGKTKPDWADAPTTKCPECGADSVPGNTNGNGEQVCMTCRQPLEHKGGSK